MKRWDPMAEPDVPVVRVATQMTSDYIRYILCRGLQKMKEIYPIRNPQGGVGGYQNDFAMYSAFPFRDASWLNLYERTINPAAAAAAGVPYQYLSLFKAIALTVPQEISPGYSMPGNAGLGAGFGLIVCDPAPAAAIGFFDIPDANKYDQLSTINDEVERARTAIINGVRVGEKPERIDIENHGRRVIWDGLQRRNAGGMQFLPAPPPAARQPGANSSDEALDFLLFVEAGFMMNVEFQVDDWFEVAAPAGGPLGGETTDGQNLSDLLQTAKREVAAAALSPEFGRQVARGKYISNRLSQRNELPFGRVLQVGVDELRIQLMPELGADLPATDAAA